jgi:hypothetical protein
VLTAEQPDLIESLTFGYRIEPFDPDEVLGLFRIHRALPEPPPEQPVCRVRYDPVGSPHRENQSRHLAIDDPRWIVSAVFSNVTVSTPSSCGRIMQASYPS